MNLSEAVNWIPCGLHHGRRRHRGKTAELAPDCQPRGQTTDTDQDFHARAASPKGYQAAITLLAHLIAKASAQMAVPDTTPMTTEVRAMNELKVTASHLRRTAVIYVRQSALAPARLVPAGRPQS
jgi:hypothetical protein